MAAPEGGVKGLAVAGAVNPSASAQRVGIVYTQWNPRVIDALVEGALAELLRNGVPETSIQLLQVRPITPLTDLVALSFSPS